MRQALLPTFLLCRVLFHSASVMDMVQAAPPENDACNQATSLEPGVPFTGSLEEATFDLVPLCDLGDGGRSYDGGCESENNYRGCRGVWFQVNATTTMMDKSFVSVSACGSPFEALLSVFQGDDDCSNLQCVAQNKPAYSDPSDCLGTSVYWQIDKTAVYYIFLRPSWLDSIESVSSYQVTFAQHETPTNDECSYAIELVAETSVNGTLAGATLSVLDDNNNNNMVGQKADGLSHAGVWYSLEGTGEEVTVSVCNKDFMDSWLEGCETWKEEFEFTYRECREVAEKGCLSIVTLESYPPQFGCEKAGTVIDLHSDDCDDVVVVVVEASSAKTVGDSVGSCEVTWKAMAGSTYKLNVYSAESIFSDMNFTVTTTTGAGTFTTTSPEPSMAPTSAEDDPSSTAGSVSLAVLIAAAFVVTTIVFV